MAFRFKHDFNYDIWTQEAGSKLIKATLDKDLLDTLEACLYFIEHNYEAVKATGRIEHERMTQERLAAARDEVRAAAQRGLMRMRDNLTDTQH